MLIKERAYSSNSYRFGFNGKEKDDETSAQDYGYRIYNTRLGKFLSVDPLTSSYPMLTPYQFASNCPISGVDLDGLEYYYAADGTLLWKYGTNTQVMLVNDKFVEENKGKKVLLSNLNANSTDLGMTNEELNTRAVLDVMQKYEGADSYYKWNGGESFEDKDIEKGHPGLSPIKKRQAAGAYQIQKATWDDNYVGKKIRTKYNIVDFKPRSQDKFTIGLIKDKSKALDAIKKGDFKNGYDKMSGVWRFLPGPKQQGKLEMKTLLEDTKKAISEELKGNSKVETPKGELLNDF